MDLLFFLLIAGFASFFQSITGFGMAPIAVPLALIFLDKTMVIPAMILVGTFLDIFLLFKIKSSTNKKILIPLIISSFIGMPIGVFVLKLVPLNLMKIIVGVLSIVFTCTLYFAKTNFNTFKSLKTLSGFISGVLQTSTGMSGPPVVLFLTGVGLSKDEFRKTLVIYFLILNLITIPLFYMSGLWSFQNIQFGVFSIPLTIMGAIIGDKISQKIPQREFRFLALATVFITGILAIYSGIR